MRARHLSQNTSMHAAFTLSSQDLISHMLCRPYGCLLGQEQMWLAAEASSCCMWQMNSECQNLPLTLGLSTFKFHSFHSRNLRHGSRLLPTPRIAQPMGAPAHGCVQPAVATKMLNWPCLRLDLGRKTEKNQTN